MPFAKAGYGWSWYRIEDLGTDGVPLPQADGPWVRRPSLRRPSTLVPNMWHAGVGLEWVPIRSSSSFPRGVDFGLRTSALVYRHSLGLVIEAVVPTSSGFSFAAGRAQSPMITRWVYDLALTVSF